MRAAALVLVQCVQLAACLSARRANMGGHTRRMPAPACIAGLHYGGVAHAGVLVSSTSTALNFYTQVLGMEDETHLRNPELPFPGAFVRAGAQQIHIMELPNPDPVSGRPEHGGRDRHVALTIKSLGPLKDALQQAKVPFTMSKSGRAALFCRDPDGNAFEFMETPDLV